MDPKPSAAPAEGTHEAKAGPREQGRARQQVARRSRAGRADLRSQNWLLTLAMKAIQCSQSPPSNGKGEPHDGDDLGPAGHHATDRDNPGYAMTTGVVWT